MKRTLSRLACISLCLIILSGCTQSKDVSFEHIKLQTTTSATTETSDAQLPINQRAVTFVDAGLENHLRKVLQIEEGPITVGQMKSLYQLTLDHDIAYDLSGLEFAENLKKVTLSNSTIKSLEPLTELKYLPSLYLNRVVIETVPETASWSRLTMFSAINSTLPSIDFLSGVTSLENFIDTNAGITSLEPLSGNKHLKVLNIAGNRVEDLSPIADFTLLGIIDISDNPIADIGIFAQFQNLNKLNISHTQITDLTPILKLKKLVLLTAWDSEDPTGWIFDRSQLEKLDLKGVRVEYYK